MDIKSFFKRNKKQAKRQENIPAVLSKKLPHNLSNLRRLLEDPEDLVVREFTIYGTSRQCAIAYMDGLTNEKLVQDNVIKNIQLLANKGSLPDETNALMEMIHREMMSVTGIEKVSTWDDVSNSLLYGHAIFYLDGFSTALAIDAQLWEIRSIEEPDSETVIRGPRDSFIEDLHTNLARLRRYIRDPNLRYKTYQIGRRSKKNLVVAYVDGIVHPDLFKEINRRLESIDMDDAPESGFVEQWIEDSFLSLFPQVINTERPDKASAALMEGKVVLILDGTPFVLIAPATLGNALQSPEDYYERWTIGSLIRVLRYIAAFIAVFLPALYVALVSFHQGMIPSKLAFSIAATREGVPFPAFIEALLMVSTMEMLREAGARLPTTIGQTIGIVGGIVIGEAAVQAGIVSPIMVVVVALNAIASFSIPSYSFSIALRILVYIMMFAAALFGIYGIILCYIMINIHVVNLTSIGVAYSSPFAPMFFQDFNDFILRVPIPLINRRPKYMQTEDEKSADQGGA